LIARRGAVWPTLGRVKGRTNGSGWSRRREAVCGLQGGGRCGAGEERIALGLHWTGSGHSLRWAGVAARQVRARAVCRAEAVLELPNSTQKTSKVVESAACMRVGGQELGTAGNESEKIGAWGAEGGKGCSTDGRRWSAPRWWRGTGQGQGVDHEEGSGAVQQSVGRWRGAREVGSLREVVGTEARAEGGGEGEGAKCCLTVAVPLGSGSGEWGVKQTDVRGRGRGGREALLGSWSRWLGRGGPSHLVVVEEDPTRRLSRCARGGGRGRSG